MTGRSAKPCPIHTLLFETVNEPLAVCVRPEVEDRL